MDIVLVCDLSEINLGLLERIYNAIDKYIQITVTIDYVANRILINLTHNLDNVMYIKECSSKNLLLTIKKLNP